MKSILLMFLSATLLTSCVPGVKCLILDELGVSKNGKRPYHIEQIGGNYNDVRFLNDTCKKGDIVKVKIKVK